MAEAAHKKTVLEAEAVADAQAMKVPEPIKQCHEGASANKEIKKGASANKKGYEGASVYIKKG